MRVEIKGMEALAQQLRALADYPVRESGRLLAQAQREALKPMQQDVRERLSGQGGKPNGRRTGALSKAYVIRSGGRRGLKSLMKLGVSKKRFGPYFPARYAHLVEFGTEPHFQPNRGTTHPGARKFPHLRPALFSKQDDTLRVLGREVYSDIRRLALKSRGRRR